MNRCRLCIMPDTRPDTHFVDGICSACISYAKRQSIDWASRRNALLQLLDTTPRNGSGYDCIVPSSGGKDSTWQVLQLLNLGARPLVVTATTCHETTIGRQNIENLARHATTMQYRPNRSVRARLNRAGLELVGDISWPEHVAIFTTPFKAALATGIPLIFYGENPQEAYGGPPGADDALEMTRRWVSEFGGFLGLRPADLVGQYGLSERDIEDYMPPQAEAIERLQVRAYFLGQFLYWDSHRNAADAFTAGMRVPDEPPSRANLWDFENLDNAQTGLHDYAMFRKYGYGRAAAQASVDVRARLMSRAEAMRVAREHDGLWPFPYMGETEEDVLDPLGLTADQVMSTLARFTDSTLVRGRGARLGTDWHPNDMIAADLA